MSPVLRKGSVEEISLYKLNNKQSITKRNLNIKMLDANLNDRSQVNRSSSILRQLFIQRHLRSCQSRGLTNSLYDHINWTGT